MGMPLKGLDQKARHSKSGDSGEAAHGDAAESYKRAAAEAAVALIRSGMLLGIGTGSTARYVVEALGRRLAEGELRDVAGIATSRATAEQAAAHGVPLRQLESGATPALTIDGADEIGPGLALIKGGGGALVRERMVADASREMVVVADHTKRVRVLGGGFALPVAVLPFGWSTHVDAADGLGADARLRMAADGGPFVTDDGLYVLDLTFEKGIDDPGFVERRLLERVGVVATGLFLGLARRAFVGGPEGVVELTPEGGG